ncbi:efflux RND transporter periplasmic adaptor subunit [Azohydromonas caseinilytica]|uniref:Efflux RND transporter periplasmic adaptor subunit n=1 Tax=Azohydromonas caseinilytica TaxID=2728836 RepID=A0A848F884_9BURK|nr:efflux RND transporter periplasmic adaptor subunit [Azohydromonas caseinilytica]NML14251.1 efflux RND transporter periplasmic adaptor subunit [Azohydromonas caseinilytica]
MKPQDKAPAPDLEALLGPGATPRPWWRRSATWIAAGLLAAAVAGGLVWQSRQAQQAAPVFVTEPVTRGDLQLSVSANGTLQPTRTVNIGSELSGTVARVLVDVNDQVKKGQVLVELDQTRLKGQLERSRATLASNRAKVAQVEATLKEAQAQLSRFEEVARLSGGKVPSATELDSARAAVSRAQSDLAAARASVTDAQAQVLIDETNLGKTAIRSPIDGVVLTRAVDPGNAVAASLQAVTLFTLAEDLRRMRLQVNVDEADVGSVQVGQKADFSVSAWPQRRYPASVTRVAFGSATTDNVVTYPTLLEVENEDLSLRPGMTATATIHSEPRRGVLLVPNQALRFTPAMAAAPQDGAAPGGGGGVASVLMPRMPRGGRKQATESAAGGATKTLWLLREGRPEAVTVTTGASDGRRTEVRSEQLQPGMAVIVDQRSQPR